MVAASPSPQPAPCMIAATSSASFDAATVGMVFSGGSSVNLRIRRRRRAFEKIEIAALVGLRDVLLVERAEAALELRRRPLPRARGGASSSALTLSSSRRAGTSSSIMSPSLTSASGPPTYDSGATCSTHAP